MEIPIEQAIDFLDRCCAMSDEDGELFYPKMHDDEADLFATFYMRYGVLNFTTSVNPTVYVENNVMYLRDSNGYLRRFYLLGPMKLD
jgi:hypothetical protein